MIIRTAQELPVGPTSARLEALLDSISGDQLRGWVETIARPRHSDAEPSTNRLVCRWIAAMLRKFGFAVRIEGTFRNVVAASAAARRDVILVGAHYDSVPGTPGADDNASAVAAMLGCALACSTWATALPVVFVAFNAEEDGMLGSRDFVTSFLPTTGWSIRCAHILEMVGFVSRAPGSQRVPAELPITLPDRGDFLGLLANRQSATALDETLQSARSYRPQFPVHALELPFGLERVIPILLRSDHSPFWAKRIPALMWTDTAEFRNPHYHQESDLPDSLDYDFLRTVTQVLTASVIPQAEAAL
jgi:hypothetical protein